VIIRRAFYFALFPAAAVLPAWLLVGWALFGAGGWGLLGVLLGSLALFIGMMATSALIIARATVREQRAVAWPDVGLQFLNYAAIAALGFFPPVGSVLVVLVILLSIATFWIVLWELFADMRQRVRTVFAGFENAAQSQGTAAPGIRADGEYIVIETSTTAKPDQDSRN
jgi:hypothetical protein